MNARPIQIGITQTANRILPLQALAIAPPRWPQNIHSEKELADTYTSVHQDECTPDSDRNNPACKPYPASPGFGDRTTPMAAKHPFGERVSGHIYVGSSR